MPTRNINLTDHYDGFVAEQLATGKFQNASEVIRTALSLLEQKTAEDEAKIEALRNEVMIGVEQYERGEYIKLDNADDRNKFFADIHAEIKAEIDAENH
ncbi:MAG: type II toxin-antitoxin system ParD family antitoxin [Alphaproteobacteria bacterium CG11_big_fil_rev_8_21_14_0_20_39_49]|nr:MAG: type II toxin-antitoxin system ParD family antitoxin [Alphaproteobacteria bacterium CG11_big_fil_rev_8_21_14_0_20_39_49]